MANDSRYHSLVNVNRSTKNMKLFIAVGVLVALLGISEAGKNATEAIKCCASEFPTVTNKDVNTYFGGIFSEGRANTTGNDVAQYTTCVYVESETLSLYGDLYVDVLVKKWFAGQTKEVTNNVTNALQECSYTYSGASNNTSDDACDHYSYLSTFTPNFHNCVFAILPQIISYLSTPLYPHASDE